ncbi:protein disulfide oxidoreductase [Candidatus Methanoperedens nitratireducens]|uniref:Glutaredoxin-like domain protein n=1 Tax=Candidatus Methanoperedens nitratireducens TaxID=1392998 RepID=A0A284VJ91_9EURY|nr:thioredoxin family protein [Candidatus Methanoperedens nitroreducens]SNQ59332.1 Glutaredoxin-like domain protein [Candidatus Methanoperedens nitroreducens]
MVLSESQKQIIRNKFAALAGDVELIVFTQEHECQLCRENRELVLELGTLSPRIKTKVYDFVINGDQDIKYKINKIPAIALVGKSDYGIRYYGMPAGYEFAVIVDDIVDVSKGTTSLPDIIKKKLSEIKKPVHIQVFVTPTCPFCPRAARLAHQFAIENEFVRSDVIEMTEFPYLVQKYNIMSTPHIVINENTSFVGAQPPEVFIDQIFMALRSGYDPMYS